MSRISFVDVPGGRNLAIINGELPDESEWREIESRDLGLNVLAMPGQASDLGPLLPWALRIRHLYVNSYTCSDLRLLPSFASLESLALGGRVTKRPADYRPAALRLYSGPLKGFESTMGAPSIRILKLIMNGASSLPELADSLEDLSLLSARAVRRLDLQHNQKLSSLKVHGARELSLQGLPQSLRTLHLEQCAEVADAEAVLDMQHLEDFWLEDIGRFHPLEGLEGLRARVRVVGRSPFDANFRARMPSNWTFPPGSRA